MEPREIKKKDYTVQIGYSPKATKEKLMKFISKNGDEFEISAEEMATMLIGGVNSNTLEATFVESDKISVVEVDRQLKFVLDRDMKKGEEINVNYKHPYPLEFALIEEAYKIAKIDESIPRIELTKDYIKEVRKKTKPEMKNYIKKFYESFKNINLTNKKSWQKKQQTKSQQPKKQTKK